MFGSIFFYLGKELIIYFGMSNVLSILFVLRQFSSLLFYILYIFPFVNNCRMTEGVSLQTL